MSQQLNLSPQLFQEVRNLLVQHDNSAQDPNVMVHYLSAMLGYLLAQPYFSSQSKPELLQELYAFSEHVLKQVEVPTAPAYGMWNPQTKMITPK